MARTIDEILEEARGRLVRVTPEQAHSEMRDGALLVDIRPAAQRAAEGEVPGALIVERNVLEWRLDPASDARLPEATGHDLRVIVLCSEGYTSSLAAASLHDLGLTRATDVIGGFKAWCAAGLPTVGNGRPDGVAPANDPRPRSRTSGGTPDRPGRRRRCRPTISGPVLTEFRGMTFTLVSAICPLRSADPDKT